MAIKSFAHWHPFSRMLAGILLGGLIGMILGIFFIFILEFLDNVLKWLWGTRQYGKGGSSFSLFMFYPEWDLGMIVGTLIGGILGGISINKKQ